MQSVRRLSSLCRRSLGSCSSITARDLCSPSVSPQKASGSALLNALTSRTVSPCHARSTFHIQHKSRWPAKFLIQMRSIQSVSRSGKKLCGGGLLGFSGVGGALYFSPNVAHAMTGEMEGRLLDSDDPVDFMKQDLDSLWALTKKYQLPAVLLMTVMFGWRHPVVLAINVALLLFCTKPSPFSVYIFIEQLRRRAMRQHPGLSKTRLFYAKRVEVQDYKLLCYARVELRDAKLRLIGILGSWWILQSSSN